MLAERGAVPVVVGLRDTDSETDAWRLDGLETRLVDPVGPKALAYAPGLVDVLRNAELDLLHLHGIWQYPSHAADAWAKATGKPLVVSPHGMLDPWITSRNAWKKHLARSAWEKRSWNAASVFHALTKSEAQDIAQETRAERIEIVPNPAPPPGPVGVLPRSAAVLYIGRIHAKKNLANLISAWIKARPSLPADATLTIAGWGDDAGIAALEQAVGHRADDDIEFVGTAFGSQKAALFDVTRFVILPSVSEGLPMAILEAWSAGVPTIMTSHCHLPEGFAQGAALECGTDVASIRDALIEALAMPDMRWQEMAAAARGLSAGPFAPVTVGRRWEEIYRSLLGAKAG